MGRDVEAEAVEAVKVLWERKHFEERSWKQTPKRQTLSGAGSGNKKYSTASISLILMQDFRDVRL